MAAENREKVYWPFWNPGTIFESEPLELPVNRCSVLEEQAENFFSSHPGHVANVYMSDHNPRHHGIPGRHVSRKERDVNILGHPEHLTLRLAKWAEIY